MSAANKDLIKFTRSLLSKGASGFRARALGLYLTFLKERGYATVESKLDQSTYFSRKPLGWHVCRELLDEYEAAGFSDEGKLRQEDLFEVWLNNGAYGALKPVTPRVKKLRPSNKGADRAAE
jgi:hypothetical protein